MYGLVGLTALCSLAHLAVGIYTAEVFVNQEGTCAPTYKYYSYEGDSLYSKQEYILSKHEDEFDHCQEKWFRVVFAFVSGFLWGGVTGSLLFLQYKSRNVGSNSQ